MSDIFDPNLPGSPANPSTWQGPILFADGTATPVFIAGEPTPPPPVDEVVAILPELGSENFAQIVDGVCSQREDTMGNSSAYIMCEPPELVQGSLVEFTWEGRVPFSPVSDNFTSYYAIYGIVDSERLDQLTENTHGDKRGFYYATTGSALNVPGAGIRVGGDTLQDMEYFSSALQNAINDGGAAVTVFHSISLGADLWQAGATIAVGVSGGILYVYYTLGDGTPVAGASHALEADLLTAFDTNSARVAISFIWPDPQVSVSAASRGAAFYNAFTSTPVTDWVMADGVL